MSAKKPTATDLDLLEREDAPGSGLKSAAAVPLGPPDKWGMIYLLARIFYAMRQRSEDALGPNNLTPMQFTILASLKQWRGLSSAELSRRFGVTPQTMGEMIGNLERRALIVRVQDPSNRRALRLSLTPPGERMLEVCEAAMQTVEAQMFEHMSGRDLEALRQRLIGLHDHLGLAYDD